jgi:acyl-coenzyme A thioesterase PaaI-like protein
MDLIHPKALNEKQKAFQKAMLSPLKFRWFLFWNLPSVLFWGIKISKLNLERCEVTLPYSYRTKNPFQSIYFAAIAGAAELASGALCLLHLQGNHRFSTLVTGVEGTFLKKANRKITFSCKEGDKIKAACASLTKAGDTTSLRLAVDGKNPEGELVAQFLIIWSFKVKG